MSTVASSKTEIPKGLDTRVLARILEEGYGPGAALDAEQGRLAAAVAGLAKARSKPPLSEAERFELLLGVTCHAVYHAGQVQLVKRLHGA